jgi:[ribosomal protein S5]-alanine N-acetyltransferase
MAALAEGYVAETVRLKLRWSEAADAPLWQAYLNDFDVSKMMARVPFPYTAADAEEGLALHRANRASGAGLNCTIFADMLIGGISLNDIANGEGTLGYWIAKPYWGRGFASEAARAMVRHGFTALGLNAINAGYQSENPVSGRVLEKVGFVETGRGPHFCRARDIDVEQINTRLTRSRWKELQ